METLAAEIYLQKPVSQSSLSEESSYHNRVQQYKFKIKSKRLSKKCGVRAKSIRDIWNHKTWVFYTVHLWNQSTDSSTLE
jgi:hypothetical protein